MAPVQYLSLLVTGLIVTLIILRIKITPQKKGLRFVVLFLMLHVIVFYIFVILRDNGINSFPKTFLFSSWSSILRAHSLLTYLLLEGYGYWRDKWIKPD